jgi:hypothetical protein
MSDVGCILYSNRGPPIVVVPDRYALLLYRAKRRPRILLRGMCSVGRGIQCAATQTITHSPILAVLSYHRTTTIIAYCPPRAPLTERQPTVNYSCARRPPLSASTLQPYSPALTIIQDKCRYPSPCLVSPRRREGGAGRWLEQKETWWANC